MADFKRITRSENLIIKSQDFLQRRFSLSRIIIFSVESICRIVLLTLKFHKKRIKILLDLF